MSSGIELTESEYDLMGRVCQFASDRLGPEQSVYLGTMYSKSLNCPVYLVVALGEDALALEKILTKARTPDQMIELARTKGF